VIGVASDLHYAGVNKPAPTTVHWPLLVAHFEGQEILPSRMVTLVVRSDRAGSATLVDALRQAVWSVNSALPIAEVQTMNDYLAKSLARTSFTLVMLSIAAGMALLLGLVGIYGVIAYSVSQRRREIGVRLAIGAQPSQVLAVFVRSGLVLTACGAVIGIGASAALMRVMSSLLFGVQAVDLPTYAGACIALLAASFIATWVPSRRAMRVDPAEALRSE
jgi:ABC-type antimicrobial peptide transport system permease subunit